MFQLIHGFESIYQNVVSFNSKKLGIDLGIEGSSFLDKNSINEMFILLLSTDEAVQEIFDFYKFEIAFRR